MSKYRAKKKEREQQQLLPDKERRQMAAKKREAAKKKAQKAKLKRDKEKMTKKKKKKASISTKAWRLKVKISNSRPEQSTPLPPKENPFSSSSAEKRAVKQGKHALPNTPRRRKRVIEKLSSSSDLQHGHSDTSNMKSQSNRLNIRRQKTKSIYWEVKGRKPRKDKIPEEVKKEVKKFYLRGDISKELPSKKDVLNLKGKDGKVTIIQKHLMAITLQEAHKVFTEEILT
ncbi:histone H1-beta, late embryonic-like [Montipora capricornis]|uniref:histone H1-beta, late embryonic-like n=1 Tax=Montipora capricornis TaxID=246305 RepID=UPI0035F16897